VVFGFDTEVLKYRVGPESLHMILRGISMRELQQGETCDWKTLPNFQFDRAGWDNVDRNLGALSAAVCIGESPHRRLRDHATNFSSAHASWTNSPGPFAAVMASSPMKKSRSSVPRLVDRWPVGPAPPVRKDGLFATAGRPDPVPPLPAAGPLVAMAVGKTKEGESLPANPVAAATRHRG
jgi:hypothetical protein